MPILKPLVETAFGRPSPRQPIWFLRQAGRYLPEYMAVRSSFEFVELCQNPKLAAEVTLQPLRRYDVDAAIIFSDILIPCIAMGQTLSFGKGHGPILSEPVRTGEAIARLRRPVAERELGYVGDAIVETKKGLHPQQTMIGFAGAPFTVATYMVEGSGSKTFNEIKKLRYGAPADFQALLRHIASVTSDYLMMQVKAGAECLMLFDTWANQLTPDDYRDFAVPAVKAIIDELKAAFPAVPVIYFPGQGTDVLRELDGLRADVLAIDWRVRLTHALHVIRQTGLDVSVQGNLDPQVLVAPEAVVRAETRRVLAAGRQARGHIFNVGHGLLPHVNPEAVSWVVDEVRRAGA